MARRRSVAAPVEFKGEANTIAGILSGRRRALWILFLVELVAIHGMLWWNAREGLRAGNQDFTAFYTAGKMVSQGEGARLYDRDRQFQLQREFAPGAETAALPRLYIHPPVEALVFVPFARLHYFQAYLLWVVVNLIALAVAIMVLRREAPGLREQPYALSWLAALGFFPAFMALVQGQDILLLLPLYALAWVATKRNSDFTAGCWLGLGLFRFHLVLPFLLVLALRKKWPALGGSAVVALLLGVISAAVVGWRQTLEYPAYLLRMANEVDGGVNNPAHMPNLNGLLDVVLPQRVALFAVAVASVAILWVTARGWKSGGDRELLPLQFSLALIATLLASYHAYDYDLSLALIPLLLTLDHVLTHTTSRGVQWLLLAPPFLLFLTPLHLILLYRWRYSCLLAIALLFWFWGVAREIRQISNDPPGHGVAV